MVGRFAAEEGTRLSSPGLADLARALAGEERADESVWRSYRDSFSGAVVQLEQELPIIAGRPDFQSAVAWQNHHVLKRAVLPLQDRRPGVDARASRHRQRAELVASYWQRYCLKNDTIGFFGPVWWARIADDQPTSFTPGSRLLESQEVFFETWTIERFAAALAHDLELYDWLSPRRAPQLRVDGTRVYPPHAPSEVVGPAVAEAQRRCTGALPAMRLAVGLCADGYVSDPAGALEILRELRLRKWILWRLEVAADPRP